MRSETKNNPALSENKQPVQSDERSWNKMRYPIWLISVRHYPNTYHAYHMDHIICTIWYLGGKHAWNFFLILVVKSTAPNKISPNKIFDPSLKMGWKELFSTSSDSSTILVWSHFFFALVFFFSSPGSIILR